ncbi:VOC family protein [Actinoplanes sp. URMC 104]|uniref:VOC family protein n=1 Tax=Actinoplanes sp. URMC 104 TaxID=3423409 RepID=UPI003F1D8170
MSDTDKHVGITVGGIDAAVEFYTSVLNCRLIRRFTPGGHDGVRSLVGLPSADLDAAFLALPDGRVLELLHFRAPQVVAAEPSPAAVGTVHLAVPVTDLATTLDRLKARHGTVVGGPVQLDEAALAYVRDPDGALLELIESTGNDDD